ncbi:MAG TPA: ribosomal protein S18-alanine N-acetyltransferase [Psychrobacter pasteurii]|nr:ribosomal protein S18-alanine N-acetyltransferase [Psychrobacter pasteurii]
MNLISKANIIQITADQQDQSLLQQVADIEHRVQLDSWDKLQIEELLQQDINQCWAILSSEDNKPQVAAYCIISSVFEVAEVLRIGTHPQFQRRGLAQSLLQALIKSMPEKQLERVLLEVRQDNTPAITLYKKMGFEVIHIRKDYYSIPIDEAGGETKCDALIMQYELANH